MLKAFSQLSTCFHAQDIEGNSLKLLIRTDIKAANSNPYALYKEVMNMIYGQCQSGYAEGTIKFFLTIFQECEMIYLQSCLLNI